MEINQNHRDTVTGEQTFLYNKYMFRKWGKVKYFETDGHNVLQKRKKKD